MAGTILTPKAIWSGFNISETVGSEIIGENIVDDIVISELSIEGRKIGEESVDIYGVLAKSKQIALAPAILVVQDFEDGVDQKLIIDLAKKGYTVLSIDLAGKVDGKEKYTTYPESIDYANYEKVKDNINYVETDAIHTCWYEWTIATRYALKYLANLPYVTKVGGLGIAQASTVMWQVAGTDENLACAVFALNAGWAGYRGIFKFSGVSEPQFTDDMYKFIAGIEPQAYAMHVHCPTLLLSATNSNIYDADRAHDTISRIDKSVYKALHYSVGFRERVSAEAYRNACIFFNEFLMRNNGANHLPNDIDIKCNLENGVAVIQVELEEENLKDVGVFISEQMIDPSIRSWQKLKGKKKDGYYEFNYNPYPQSGIITAFARAEYKNGFSICSNIIAKQFKQEEVLKGFKEKVLYSSRLENSESIFSAANQPVGDNTKHIIISQDKRIKVEKGPMEICGTTCEWGLLTFKVGAEKFKPSDDAVLMLDVYAKEKSELSVKFICDYFGAKTEYVARVKLLGGEVWYNVKLELNRFKTAEGMGLKTFDKVNAVEFYVEGTKYLINNVLWV